MSAFSTLVRRDVGLALRDTAGLGTALGFNLLVVTLLPLGLGPDLALLSRIAPGILWVALLLAVLLTLDRLFHADHEDGTLELIAMGRLPLELVVAGKALAHWLTTALPLVAIAPLLGLMLNLPLGDHVWVVVSMLIGTPALSCAGAIGAALTLGLRRGGLLASLLVLPFYVPTLIFGVSAVAGAAGHASPLPSLAILAAVTLAMAVLGPLFAAMALRTHLR